MAFAEPSPFADVSALVSSRDAGARYVTFEHCELHPDGAGYLQVHVGYAVELSCL